MQIAKLIVDVVSYGFDNHLKYFCSSDPSVEHPTSSRVASHERPRCLIRIPMTIPLRVPRAEVYSG